MNVTHTICNNAVCTSSFLLTQATLRPLLPTCVSEVATDKHWTNSTWAFYHCPAATTGGRAAAVLQSCAAPSYGPGPGLFPTPQVPCSAECNSLFRAEADLLEALLGATVSTLDRDILSAAHYQLQVSRNATATQPILSPHSTGTQLTMTVLQDECQAAFPKVWFKPRYDRGLLFGVARSGRGPGSTVLPSHGLELPVWGGRHRQHVDLSPAQPAVMALDASTGRVYPVASLPLHEHSPGMVCFDEKKQVCCTNRTVPRGNTTVDTVCLSSMPPQVYYLLGVRLHGFSGSFVQTTHLLGVDVLSGVILLDVPFNHTVLSIRYDNVNSSLLAVVHHGARQVCFPGALARANHPMLALN